MISFTCQAGFDLVGSARARCVSGRWNKPAPSCVARCTHPGVPPHGIIERLSLLDGGKTRYRCDLGFSLIGSHEITCRQGQWVPRPPTCKGGCADPGKPTNGVREGNDFNNGRSVMFRCLRGYTLEGVARITCRAGSWTGVPPTCQAACSDPGIPSQGMRSGDDFRHSGRVYYFCYDGFTLVGHGKAVCHDGRWSTPLPRCVVGCSDPGSPSRGARIGTDFTDGKTVRFGCNQTGYDVIGASVIRCMNGTWNAPTPTCKARCQPFKLSARLTASQPISVRHGSLVSFSCQSGSRLVGSPALLCADGAWNDSLPTCVDDGDGNASGSASGSGDGELDSCADPGVPAFGGRRGNSFSSGQRIKFFCNQGYTLFGSSQITCDDGAWSELVPSCRANCKDPGIPQNGGRHGNNFAEGQRVGFFCNDRYVMEGASEAMCVDGKWSHLAPACRDDGCSKPPDVQNARLYGRRKSFYRNKEFVYYLCDKGHYMAGRRDLQCQAKTWTKPAFRCIAKGCGNPGTPRNGNKYGMIYRALFKVHYKCQSGYKLVGSSTRMCQTNRTWTGILPSCAPLECPRLPMPKFGMMQVTKTTFNGVAKFTCVSRGYQLIGSKVRVCRIDGSWSGTQPSCKKITCPDPGTPRDGSRVVSSGFSYTDSIIFSCRPGFTLKGTSRTVCLDDGTWSTPVPVCVGKKQCPLNWLEHNGRCYLFKHVTRRKQMWKRIQKRCHKQKARLLSIKDNKEWRFVRQHLQSSVGQYAMGLTKKGGVWRWTGGGKVRFAKWAKAQGVRNAECGAIGGSDGLFVKISCRSRLSAYICEKIKGS